ncbi:hypothetical protein [Actinoallomurus soli]|uniref:hypothetical protein n=1 Tax=Actinoallomurus soli TaxID=2952535 RepID=UPI0020938C69|nr:hypothetical protein [Actinoallomurus soli]MCO5970550.1 hypothetical protein [Actinoallomurus soli]
MRPRAGVPGMLVRLLPVSVVRPVCLLLGGATGLVLVAVVLTPSAPHRRPGRPVVEGERPTPAAPSAAPTVPAGRDDARDTAAVAYYRSADPRAAGHVREVIWTAPILRVYTDLPATDANSPDALALCRTGAAYLEVRGRAPVVFVHARERDGYPVLANKMDLKDDCRLGRVP